MHQDHQDMCNCCRLRMYLDIVPLWIIRRRELALAIHPRTQQRQRGLGRHTMGSSGSSVSRFDRERYLQIFRPVGRQGVPVVPALLSDELGRVRDNRARSYPNMAVD